MGLFSDIFGGSKKVNTMNGQQQVLFNNLVGKLLGRTVDDEGNIADTGTGTNLLMNGAATPYSGKLTTPLSPLWGTMTGQLGNLFSSGGTQETQNALSSAMSGRAAYDVSPQATQQYFEKGLYAPAMNLFKRSIAPQIAEGFASPGGTFSSRVGTAQANALGDLNTQLVAQMAQATQANQALQAQLNEAAAGRQSSAAQFASMAPYAQAGQLAGLLGQQAGLQQQNNMAKYGEFQRTAPENNPYMQLALQLLGMQTKAVTQTQGIMPAVQAGLGIAGLPMFNQPATPAPTNPYSTVNSVGLGLGSMFR